MRAAALEAIGGNEIAGELAWDELGRDGMAPGREKGNVYVKRAADLAPERDRLAWLADRWPVPEVIGFFRRRRRLAGHERGEGVPLYDASVGLTPDRIAETARRDPARILHATDATGCPFGVRKRGNVLIHGDYCLPNVFHCHYRRPQPRSRRSPSIRR